MINTKKSPSPLGCATKVCIVLYIPKMMFHLKLYIKLKHTLQGEKGLHDRAK